MVRDVAGQARHRRCCCCRRCGARMLHRSATAAVMWCQPCIRRVIFFLVIICAPYYLNAAATAVCCRASACWHATCWLLSRCPCCRQLRLRRQQGLLPGKVASALQHVFRCSNLFSTTVQLNIWSSLFPCSSQKKTSLLTEPVANGVRQGTHRQGCSSGRCTCHAAASCWAPAANSSAVRSMRCWGSKRVH